MDIKFQWLGLVNFDQALKIQSELWQRAYQHGEIHILGLEHSSVITLGKRGDQEKDLMLSSPIPVVFTDRGGQATLHSPGQLVIYPILPLRTLRLGVREFVELLHRVTIRSLTKLGIESFEQDGHPGVFTANGKIAFTGIRIERGVSRHGISINIDNDLGLFKNIRPCGVSCPQFDSISRSAPDVNSEKFFNIWQECFKLNVDLESSESHQELSLK